MSPRRLGVFLLAIATAFLAWNVFWPATDAAHKAALRLEAGSDLPAVGLARLGEVSAHSQPPVRDIFKFGRDSQTALFPLPTPVIQLAPIPTPMPTQEIPPTPTPWPVLDVSLIGIVDNGAGRRAGSFVKDRQTVLVGEPGQVVGNAFRVIRVNVESAEIEELGSGRMRRLPLKRN